MLYYMSKKVIFGDFVQCFGPFFVGSITVRACVMHCVSPLAPGSPVRLQSRCEGCVAGQRGICLRGETASYLLPAQERRKSDGNCRLNS